MPHRPEVLAPAGDAEAMKAAVAAGADAVYFGVQEFNARARATNFALAELPDTVRRLHDHGVRGYVALNTLVFDAELTALEKTVAQCAEAGVDAVIVQDLGVARLVHAVAPNLGIHASTQMTCTEASGIELARSLGVSRVVLARELSLSEIETIAGQTDAELEVFVHGALCISYSGQCLTSEAIGGRSANRGACAQACRLPYELIVDGVKRDLGDRAFLLSPEDLEASALVPELMRIGVSALKIEGRLKGPEYVAATTALYRRAIDASLREDDRDKALQTYTRGSGPGFLAGVDHQRLVEGKSCDHRGLAVGLCHGTQRVRGRAMVALGLTAPLALGDGILVEGGWGGKGELGGRVWGLVKDGSDAKAAGAGDHVLAWLGPDKRVEGAFEARRVFKTSDPSNAAAITAGSLSTPHRVTLAIRVTGSFGEPFVLEGKSERGHAARVTSEAPVERARTAAITHDVLREKLGRLGDTPFVLGTLEVDLPDLAMLPLSALNKARRALSDALLVSRHAPTAPPSADAAAELIAAAGPPNRPPPASGLFVLCRTETQAHAAIRAGADGVVLDFLELTGTGAAVRSLRALGHPVHITLAPPRIRKPREEKIDRYLQDLAPDAILVRSLGALREIQPADVPRIGDFSLNVTNRLTAAEVLRRGLSAFTPSFDLNAVQLASLCESSFGPWAEVVVHHPMPLFHMEHCAIAALLSEGRDHKTCGRPCERHQVSLRDRAGMDHPVEADVGCRNTVFHSASQSAAGVLTTLNNRGVRRFRIELVRESEDDVVRIVTLYRELLQGSVSPADVRRKLGAEGGYGVVTGSLRVL